MNMKTFKVIWYNLGYGPQTTFYSVEDALAFIKCKGFEGAVWETIEGEQRLISSWSPIGGTRLHQEWKFD